MYLWLIVGLVAVVGFAGYTMKIEAAAHRAGMEECQAKVTAANAELTRQAGELKQEAENHITDMAAAYDAGEAKAKTRTVYVQSKGASDVAKYPVFQNPACVLPPESLRNLNAARAGFRRDPPADVVHTDAGPSPGAAARPTADSHEVPAAVRGAESVAPRDAGGDVRPSAAGRRPLGKMR